jgi:hypothetical protein
LRLRGSASGATILATPQKIRGAASHAGCGGMGCYDRDNATTAFVTLYDTIWYFLRCRLLSSPTHASSCVACCHCPPSTTRHPPPIIRCLLLLQNLPPNLVDCHHCHRPLLLHCLPPCRLTCCIIRRPPSTQRHCHRCHCCNPLLTMTALVALSATHYPLLSRCLPAAAIVSVTPSLL